MSVTRRTFLPGPPPHSSRVHMLSVTVGALHRDFLQVFESPEGYGFGGGFTSLEPSI